MELELAMPNLVNFFSRGVVRLKFCAWCHVFMGSFSLRASSLVRCIIRVLWFSHLLLVKLVRGKRTFSSVCHSYLEKIFYLVDH